MPPGNSVPTVTTDNTDCHQVWLAFANSLVGDFLIRQKISTHLNMFYVESWPLQRPKQGTAEFQQLVRDAARLVSITPEIQLAEPALDLRERARLRAEIDAIVAGLYDLSPAEFAYILTTFPLLDRDQPPLPDDFFVRWNKQGKPKLEPRSYVTRDTALLAYFRHRGIAPPDDLAVWYRDEVSVNMIDDESCPFRMGPSATWNSGSPKPTAAVPSPIFPARPRNGIPTAPTSRWKTKLSQYRRCCRQARMPNSFHVGDLLDSKYRILRLLGLGGFGEVYLAEDELLGRQVAIKLLRDQDPDHQAGLVDEMRSLDQLRHSAVGTFYTHFVDEQLLFLVMEYCAGGSLRSRMRLVPASLQTIMQWGKNLTDTLYFVHQRGIVHHDIKPDNLLFTSEDVLKIGDFGVANSNIGTIHYLAPEMWLGGVDTGDVRVDVYALGITLLELLQNRNPFDGMSPSEKQRAKMRHEFIPSELERWVQDVISKATHPTPELRFQSMREFREAIDSKHVSYVFDRSRVQSHALAAKAEKLLARKHVAAASKCISQALYVCSDCVSALIAAGRYNLFTNRIAEAKQYFDQALTLNPRTNIQKELGWLSLEACSYSLAISLLTDHLQRNAADYEAFNLLLECFYRTERYEVGMQVAKLMVDEKAPSDCFENNGLLCGLLSNSTDEEFANRALTSCATHSFAITSRS